VSGFDPVARGHGLGALVRAPQPTTPAELQRACVRWVLTLWTVIVVFQRFALPGSPVAAILPFTLAWCVYGMARGVVEVDRYRFGWWLLIASVSAMVVPLQYALVPNPLISMLSWGLVLTSWLIFVFRIRDRRRATYMLLLRGIVRISLWLSALVTVMMASQLVLPYQDWLAKVVPKSLLLNGFVITYPLGYGSSFYKGNGWIGLEPSIVSFQLGVGLLAALLIRAKLPVVLFLGLGMACTTAGSGPAVVGAGLVVILFSQMRWALARYAVVVPAIVAFLITPYGAPLLARATEGTGTNSSTGLRTTAGYQVLWPQWIDNPMSVLFGRGPGSSQRLVDQTNITGLLVPNVAKMFFDFGVIAGLALAAFMMFMYLGGPSRAMAIALGASLWTLQPDTFVLLIAVPVAVTWWTPRTRQMIESDVVPSPNATIVPPPGGRPRAEIHR